jgi:DNA (cytosine-5)-methyltransferase 1
MSTYGVKASRSTPLRLAMHPTAPDPGSFRSWVRESERPIAVDLFCGAGGLSSGLEAAGYRVALAVDIDQWALETHAHNFEGLALHLDLAEEDARDAVVRLLDGADIALIAGGPPCQPYSRAGRSKIRSLVAVGAREEADHRRELWRAFLDVVERVGPHAVLMENVPDMALYDDMAVVRIIVHRLEQAGYDVDARIVDTWLYGVPQHRQRLVIVGIRDGGSFAWPDAVDRVTLRDAIGDLPVLDPEAEEVGAETLPYAGPISDFQMRARKGCFGDAADVIRDHVTRAVRPDDLEAFRLMRPGTLYSDLPRELQRYRDDIFDDKYNRLDWGDLSRSITAHIAKDGYWYIHPDQHRTLTVREAARVQTFPDHFRFAGSRSHQFAQIGNAVPPVVGETAGATVLTATRTFAPAAESTSAWRERFRLLAEKWGEQDRRGARWAYPAEPWAVFVGLMLGARGDARWPSPADALDLIPNWPDATRERLTTLATMADSGRRRSAVDKLSQVAEFVRNDPEGWLGTSWFEAAKFGPAAARWMDLLALGGDGLATSSSGLRVVARVTGTGVDRQNRMSWGRMELAKLVGHGERAALINAATHRLGEQVCTAEEPACGACPVSAVCRSSTC